MIALDERTVSRPAESLGVRDTSARRAPLDQELLARASLKAAIARQRTALAAGDTVDWTTIEHAMDQFIDTLPVRAR